MPPSGARSGSSRVLIASLAVLLAGPPVTPARADAPEVLLGPSSVRIRGTAPSLVEAIEALSRAGGVKVTYEGPRPAARLFDLDLHAPSVAQALLQLLDGQGLNYGMVFDLSGRKVTSVLILGPLARGAAGGAARPQALSAPRPPRNDLPPVDDDPALEETAPEEPTPEPEATPEPTPAVPAPLDRQVPVMSPFAPRPPFGSPFGAPRPAPSPSPSPLS